MIIIKKFKSYLDYCIIFCILLIIFLVIILFMTKKQIKEGFFETHLENNKIVCFWTGDNNMSNNRLEAIENLKQVSECNIVLIKKNDIESYILKEHPLHPAFEYLSETHKADYLRTYFMHFYGGGYSDIKKTTGSWKQSFEKLKNSDKWICGYREVQYGVAYQPLSNEWEKFIGNGAYICKPQTPFTTEWYNEMIKLLDTKLEKLKEHPSSRPDNSTEKGTNYPIEWNEMLGRIFHRVIYKYLDHISYDLSLPIFVNYR